MDTTIMLKNGGGGKKDRIVWFDNIKFFLMLLCVIGHISLSDYGNLQFPIVRIIHLFIYTFHVPMFIILNGFKLLYITSYSKLLFLIIISIIVTLIFSSNIFKFPLINSLKFIEEE